MTLIQAQEKYISRVNSCHTGHRNRVQKSARLQLAQWLLTNGHYEMRMEIMKDADDMATLERNAE